MTLKTSIRLQHALAGQSRNALPLLACLGLLWLAAPALSAEIATVDRPMFDRAANDVLIPYHGSAPAFSVQSVDSGTVLLADFASSRARIGSVFKMGVFHPLVSQVEMTPYPNEGRVRVAVHVTPPCRLVVTPDARRGVLRLHVVPGAPEDSQTASNYFPAPVPTLPPQPIVIGHTTDRPGLDPLTPVPPPYTPYAEPSLPPVGPGSGVAPGPLPGTPASGTYVYRKAIPVGNGRDVTEVEIRTGQKAQVDIAHDPQSESLVVNVERSQNRSGWDGGGYAKRPWSQDIFENPVPEGELSFKPVAAVDSMLGLALMSEKAPNLGTDFKGAGSTVWGLAGSLPLGRSANLSLAADSFAYTIKSLQVPDAPFRRDEYFVRLQGEWLPMRSPWVFAFGPGYWLRYVSNKQTSGDTLLGPPDPSLLTAGNELQHGPALNARVYYPLWRALAATAEVGAAPYLLGSGDALATKLGATYGYQGELALKWSTRHLAATLGYRQVGFGNYNHDYAFNRGGPEVSLIWHF